MWPTIGLLNKMKIAVGSLNPTKINAAKLAFGKVFPHETIEVVGVATPSGVSDQPTGNTETLRGATNRAKKALAQIGADFGVGEEGGMDEIEGKWFETGWCVVVDTKGTVGIGSSIRMEVPPVLLRHINHGEKELGVATDIVFGTIESGKKAGFFGMMSNGTIDRTAAYADGILAALTRFLHPHLY